MQGTHTFVTSYPKGLSLLCLSIPTRFPPSLPPWFSSGWNRTWFLIISQTPPSLWLVVFLLPPSCVESSALSVNPGLSCPAVCIPSLLGEHGTAPGPLCSHRREVNEWERERQEREKGERYSWAVSRLSQLLEHRTALSVIEYQSHTLSHINKGEKTEKGRMTASLSQLWVQMWMKKEETSVTSWVPPHRNISQLGVVSSSPLTLKRD